jgi:sugar phosphate isomerase/epimerase
VSQTSNLSRRQLLAGLSGTTAASVLAATPSRPLGAQLYTVRSILAKDPDRVLKEIATIGYTEVEGYNRPQTVTLAAKIKQYGLTLRSCHVETPLITNDWERYPDLKPVPLPDAIESVRNAEIEYFTMAYISPGARGDSDDFYRRTADRMNAAAELCRKAGLKFAYHNHAFEFEGPPGRRPIDYFRERLDQKLVGLEMDVFWASVAGNDPVELLRTWKGRVSMLHLKDKAKGVPVQFSETTGQGAFVEVGSGVLDFPAILKAAPAAGVKYYFVEQDQTPGDPLESLRKSFDYLKTVR